MARAHAWLSELCNGDHASIESLAKTAKLHAKVIRQGLRLAFLAPDITKSIIQGEQPASLTLAAIPKTLALRWAGQYQSLNEA